MDFEEWVDETVDPSNPGEIAFATPDPNRRVSTGPVILKFILAMAVLAGWFYFLWRLEVLPTAQKWAIWSGATFAYLILGYCVNPKPDMSMPALPEGDPTEVLFILRILLWPGRCLAVWTISNPLQLMSQKGNEAKLLQARQQQLQRGQELNEHLARFMQKPDANSNSGQPPANEKEPGRSG